MTRVTGFAGIWLGFLVLAAFSHAYAQQNQQPAPVAQGTADSQAQQSAPAPAAVDPNTGAPLSPEDQREKEIDKYDPLKRDTNPLGQNVPPATDRQSPAAVVNPGDKETPLPGSVAASDQAAAASQSGSASGQQQSDDSDNGLGYTGPAVLTRSYTLARPMTPQQLKWIATFGLSYAWDEGQSPAVIVEANPYASVSAQSINVSWGLSGRHIWKHDQIGLDYGGNYSEYSLGSLSGMNNSLNLDYTHLISRHLSFQFVESLQDLSQNYTLGNPVLEPGSSPANINLATSPNVQLLNSTVRQSSSSVSMTFQQTNRLSYNLSGSYFIIGRTGIGVDGMTGQQYGADVNYRWTRRATVGVYYSYTNYLYSHNISQADSNGVGVIYSYSLGPHTQLRTRFGAVRIESLAYETVTVPPALAAILGQSAAIINAYSLNWTSDVSAELVKDFHRNRTASLSYAHGESPGNGVLLTSVQETISGGYTMALFRRVPLSTGVIYSSLASVLQSELGSYKSETVYVGLSRPITRHVSATFRVDYQRYLITGSPLEEHDLRISLGLAWSPPENALRF